MILRTLSLLYCAVLAGCQAGQIPRPMPSSPPGGGYNRSTEVPKGPVPYAKLDELKSRFSGYQWSDVPETPALTAEFAEIRRTSGWSAFSKALRNCDDAVNALLDEDILDWSGASGKVRQVNTARNAWRHACTYGIKPPKLTTGWTSFEENGLSFRVYVAGSTYGTVVVRSQRGQVLGIFELQLQTVGQQHLVSHMLEKALRFPDSYLSYPWDIVMATDTIFIDDVWVELDRITGKAKIQEKHGSETVTK